MPTHQKKLHTGLKLLLKPIHRVFIGLLFSAIAFLIFKQSLNTPLVLTTFLWDVFALFYVASSWIVFLSYSIEDIKHYAQQEDGSRIFVYLLVLLSSFASMLSVLLLMLSKDDLSIPVGVYLAIVITAILASWSIVHTTFCFHYANLFYNESNKDEVGGLEFPGKHHPNYLDFAYFSFVIGMTFQVSDVQISSKEIRKTALLHGLLSFCLNTFVVALTINIIAGLNK